MSPLTRSTYLSVLTSTITFLIYSWWIFQVLGVGYFSGPDALIRIGKAIAVLIIAGFALEIIVQLGAIFLAYTNILGNTQAEVIVDERDKLIVYRSIYISMHVLCAGLFLAIGALAYGWQPFWVFNIIVLFYALAVATELGVKIFFIQRGYMA